MKKLFKYNHYPSTAEKVSLALASHIKIEQVNSWFYNQRKKRNFKKKELTEKQKIRIKNFKILKRVYEVDPMLEIHSELQKLKQKTKFSEAAIKKWFQNRRHRSKKKVKTFEKKQRRLSFDNYLSSLLFFSCLNQINCEILNYFLIFNNFFMIKYTFINLSTNYELPKHKRLKSILKTEYNHFIFDY